MKTLTNVIAFLWYTCFQAVEAVVEVTVTAAEAVVQVGVLTNQILLYT